MFRLRRSTQENLKQVSFFNRNRLIKLFLGFIFFIGLGVATLHFYANNQINKAKDLLINNRMSEAIEHLHRAEKIKWNDPEIYFLLGRAERMRGQYSQAEAELKKATKLLNNKPTELIQLEFMLLRALRGDLSEVYPNLEHFIESGHPDRFLILDTIISIYLYKHYYNLALKQLDVWLSLDPTSGKAYHRKGWILESLQQRVEAIEAYKKAVEYEPDQPDYRMQLIILLVDMKRFTECTEHINYLLEHFPNYSKAWYFAGKLWFSQSALEPEYLDKARDILNKLLVKEPDNDGAMALLGEIEYQTNQFVEAEALLRKAIELRPSELPNYHLLSQILVSLGKNEEGEKLLNKYEKLRKLSQRAHEVINKVIPKNPRNPAGYIEAGETYLQIFRPDEAIIWVQHGLEIAPQSQKLHLLAAETYQQLNRDKDAEFHTALAKKYSKN